MRISVCFDNSMEYNINLSNVWRTKGYTFVELLNAYL